MFCIKCGAEINHGERFCSNCGYPITQNDMLVHIPKADVNSKNNKDWEKVIKKLSENRKMVSIALGIVVVVVLIIGLSGSGSTGSAKKVALVAAKYKTELKMEKYCKLLAPPYIQYMSDSWYSNIDELQDDFLEMSDDVRRKMINECGENAKMKYDVERVISCSKDEVERIRNELSRDYDYEKEDIQKAAVVFVSINVSGSDGKSTWIDKNACVKIHGKWYVHRPGFNSISY